MQSELAACNGLQTVAQESAHEQSRRHQHDTDVPTGRINVMAIQFDAETDQMAQREVACRSVVNDLEARAAQYGQRMKEEAEKEVWPFGPPSPWPEVGASPQPLRPLLLRLPTFCFTWLWRWGHPRRKRKRRWAHPHRLSTLPFLSTHCVAPPPYESGTDGDMRGVSVVC